MAVIEYIKAWNRWRKGSLDSTLYKICVLLRLIKSPTFEQLRVIWREYGGRTMMNEIDRIQCAIRHIQTSVDIDPWAMEIAVEAMEKQIPKNPIRNERWLGDLLVCPVCNHFFGSVCDEGYCNKCGQKLIQKRIRVVCRRAKDEN